MANKKLFESQAKKIPQVDAINNAGGDAYALEPKQALAQLAATGCLRDNYYTKAQDQLDTLLNLANEVSDDVYLAKLALYSREKAYMKDMPAVLLLLLARRNTTLFKQIFSRVVDNGRILRNVFQILRSGKFGATGMSHCMQTAFQKWFNNASVGKLLSASIGNEPTLRDILRLARPTPKNNEYRALFGWLVNKDVAKWAPATQDDLPDQVKALDAYRKSDSEQEQVRLIENYRFRWDLLADAAKGPATWKMIAKLMGAQALRMNLNTLLRHKVLDDNEIVSYVAKRIADEEEVKQSRQFPYQYLAAYLNAEADVPQKIRLALSKAAEIACGNIPELPGPIVIGLDVSGSMSSPVTGHGGHTSKMRCVDVAALFAAAMLRINPDSVVIPFDTRAHDVDLDPGDTILSLAERLAKYGGGGTNCALPLEKANSSYAKKKFCGCVLVSDNESWLNVRYSSYGSTGTMAAWKNFKKIHKSRNPKLVCIDVQANTTTQAAEGGEILNIGGFSDAVFGTVTSFLDNKNNRFVSEVESTEL